MPKSPDEKGKPRGKSEPPRKADAAREPARKPAPRAKVAFPKKNQPPVVAEFSARLPLALGKKWEATRAALAKNRGVSEELFYYGPKSGWGLRYVQGGVPLCALFIHQERPLAIVSVSSRLAEALDWDALSPVAQRARKNAHGSPSLSWLDLPLDGAGANDLRAIVKAKLRAEPVSAETPTA